MVARRAAAPHGALCRPSLPQHNLRLLGPYRYEIIGRPQCPRLQRARPQPAPNEAAVGTETKAACARRSHVLLQALELGNLVGGEPLGREAVLRHVGRRTVRHASERWKRGGAWGEGVASGRAWMAWGGEARGRGGGCRGRGRLEGRGTVWLIHAAGHMCGRWLFVGGHDDGLEHGLSKRLRSAQRPDLKCGKASRGIRKCALERREAAFQVCELSFLISCKLACRLPPL